MERVQMAEGDPELEDLELDPPVQDGDEPEDLQDQALVEDEADEPSPQGDEVDGQDRQAAQRPEQQQQPSRGESRHQRLANELREARQREADLNRRLDTLIAGQARPPQGETPEARAQRLALMTPEERITAELHDARQSFTREMQQMRFATQDGSDRAAFQAKATVDPLYKKWETRVEAELRTLREQNMNVERERLMYYLIGKAAVEGRQASKPGQRAEAQRRVARQQTRPSNSGSDVAAQRRDRGNSLERRLENQSL
jgi:hypothetical protein